jgi:hypothetical protein
MDCRVKPGKDEISRSDGFFLAGEHVLIGLDSGGRLRNLKNKT